MADGIPSFSEKANVARVTAGFKGGDMFSSPNLAPAMTVVECTGQALVDEKLDQGPITKPNVQDPWVARYPNAKL